MRVMLDTNVLISMVLFPNKRFRQMLEYIIEKHDLLISSFVIEELFAVVERKFPTKRNDVDLFLSNLAYELVYTPHNMPGNIFEIRDMNDYPVLYTAIVENVDIFITGDKDFIDVNIETPKVMTPTEFINTIIYGEV